MSFTMNAYREEIRKKEAEERARIEQEFFSTCIRVVSWLCFFFAVTYLILTVHWLTY